jgi:hypothetical protein
MIGLSKTELAAAEVIIAWRSTRSSLSQRKSGTWRRGAVTMGAGKEGRARMYARYDQTGTCAPLLILSKRWATIVMESCVTRECHAQFGERDRETRLLRSRKVRSVPTPPSFRIYSCLTCLKEREQIRHECPGLSRSGLLLSRTKSYLSDCLRKVYHISDVTDEVRCLQERCCST